MDNKGRIQTNESGQCGNTKYFAGEDAVNRGAEVGNAVQEGKNTARGIDGFLS